MNHLLLPLVVSDVPPGLLQAFDQAGVPWVRFDERSQSPQGRFHIYDSRLRGCPEAKGGQHLIDMATCDIPSGDLADDRHPAVTLCGMLTDALSSRCRWEIEGLCPEERVSRYDKSAAREQLLANVRAKVEDAGGIWATLSPVPSPHQSAFCLRVDYDKAEPVDVGRFLAAIGGYEEATSHYLCGSEYQEQHEVLSRLRGMHVGAHGYWHHTYTTAAENSGNIQRCVELLDRAGLNPCGFVAPHGRYTAGLAASLAKLGVTHSSEFSLAHDDLPFFPQDGDGKPLPTLQIPVHPISLGIVLEAAEQSVTTNIETVIECLCRHYSCWLRTNHQAGQPTWFYGHPDSRLGRYPQVVREIFRTLDALNGVWKTSLAEFETWWRERNSLRWCVEQTSAGLHVRRLSGEASHRPSVEIWHGQQVAQVAFDAPELMIQTKHAPPPNDASAQSRRSTVCPARQPCKHVQARFVSRPAPPRLHRENLTHSFSLRGAFKNFIDWERDTPRTEIRVRGIRQLLKKSMRYAFPGPHKD